MNNQTQNGMSNYELSRRDFCKLGAGVTAALAFAGLGAPRAWGATFTSDELAYMSAAELVPRGPHWADITATVNEELVHGEFLSYASISSRNNLREMQRNATLPCNSLVGGLEKRQS